MQNSNTQQTHRPEMRESFILSSEIVLWYDFSRTHRDITAMLGIKIIQDSKEDYDVQCHHEILVDNLLA